MDTPLTPADFLKRTVAEELLRIAVFYERAPDEEYMHEHEVARLFAERDARAASAPEHDR